MIEDIKNLLIDHEMYHSRFQIENFIIGSGGNAWGRYKQCLREIKKRWLNIESMKDERQLIKLDIEELNTRKKSRIKKIDRARRSLKLNSLNRQLANLEESLHHTGRELIHFVKIAKRIKKESWGDRDITKSLRESLESQMWFERVRQMLTVDVLSFGQVSKPTIEMLFKMPKNERKELFKLIDPNNREKLIEWAMM